MIRLLLLIPIFIFADINTKLDQAYETYREGERTSSIEDRSRAFNEALKLYMDVAEEKRSGELLFNIGNCYFQLAEYPWAIYYYSQAEILNPRDRKIREHLIAAKSRAGLPIEQQNPLAWLAYPHTLLSFGERIKLTLMLTLAGFCFASIAVYYPWNSYKRVRNFFTVCTALMLLSLASTHYLSPVEGILLKTSSLHRDAGNHYSAVLDEPARAGQKVQVLDVTEKGEWLKVQVLDSKFGFIPSSEVRIINSY